jgi:hypothetical protein
MQPPWASCSTARKEQRRAKEIRRVLRGDLNTRFKFAKSVAKDEALETLISWLHFLRRQLLDHIKKGEDPAQVVGRIREMQRAAYLLSHYNVNKKITLQNLMIHL